MPILHPNTNHFCDVVSFVENNHLLFTGASGMLGHAFKDTIRALGCNSDNCLFLSKQDLDVTSIMNFSPFDSFRPNYVFHCAALVDADYCETYPDKAFEAIVTGTQNTEIFSKRHDATIYFPQTFLIFDGSVPLTFEDSDPAPLSTYGLLKFRAEQLLLNSKSKVLSTRLGGFFGGGIHDKNFIGKITREIAVRGYKTSSNLEIGDRRWQPTYTNDIAANVLLLLSNHRHGVFNIASRGDATFFQLTKFIINRLGVDKRVSLSNIDASYFSKKEKAVRPNSVLLSQRKLDEEGLNLQRNWQDSVAEYLACDYFQGLISVR